MSDRADRFGISEFTTWPWSFERDVERYAARGVDCIEICEFKLDRNDYAPQLQSIARAGLGISSVQTTVHSLFPDSLAPSPRRAEDRLRHMKKSIDRIAPEVPGGTPFVVITGAAPAGNTQLVYDHCLSAFADLAGFAHERGMRIAFEPLNPVLLNTDTALWGLDQALELVQAIGHEALGICLDTWNVFQTSNLHDVIATCSGRIFLVQVSDWHRPRSGADRIGLGEGCIDNAAIMRSVRRAGYGGPYVLEIFSDESLPDSIWRADLDAVIARNAGAFTRIWDASES
jgi:sugar phosphate isomerase/epimerase